MAGIGVRLNRIYSKNTITTNIIGFGYSMVITIAPMFLIIFTVVLMQRITGFYKIDFASRELLSCTLLYTFVFSLLTSAPFNAVLSRYMSDAIYREEYEDILPCYYVGLILNIILSAMLGIPFCIWEHLVGQVPVLFVFLGYLGYMGLALVFHTMLFLSMCKDYKRISAFFLIGMLMALLLAAILVHIFHVQVIYAMMISLDSGFLLIGSLEFAQIKSYFRENSGRYMPVLECFKSNWQLVVTNTLYTVGLYVHNFVFWTTDMGMVVARSFVCATTYDMATCLAMLTNITASVIFISRVEMNYHERYKRYSEAVIGGRGMDIDNSKNRMFEQLAEELMNLVRIQFIISVVIYLLAIVFLPRLNFAGLVMQIYPCLAAGYFILFMMYSAIIFLYYFNDMNGALVTATLFFVITLVGSIWSSGLSPIWYGLGLIIGSLVGWCVAYFRIRFLERHLDIHTFCKGSIMQSGKGRKPSGKVYDNPFVRKKRVKE